MSDAIRILIVDDHAPFRTGLTALLSASDEFVIVGEIDEGSRVPAAIEQFQPDVVLMDLNMPGMSGIDATRTTVSAAPHVGVLVLTMFDDDDSVFAALQAGARGYLLKGASKAEIQQSVRAVAAGQAVFGPTIARRLQQYFAQPRPAAAPSDAFPELTTRERDILDMIAQHLTNPEIAEQLGLTEKTVRNYVSNIFAKLQVNDRSRAIMLAREAGYGR
ncbi:MAG: response regulator transcription factor [Thermomicrobiales bacterium]|nr:response regulator transcription factor [Thermomicrobiales bacterium]MCO5220489.1 response regulator transcription factor [Thermomicrobiales bacterium]